MGYSLPWIAGGAPTYVTESLPMATDHAETQLLVPPEEYLNTVEVKAMLAKEDVGGVSQEVADTAIDTQSDDVQQESQTLGQPVEAKCGEVGWYKKYIVLGSM